MDPNGAFGAGTLPRDHMKHAWCDPTFSRCVPPAVHGKLTNQLAPRHGGDRPRAAAALLAWYPTVIAGLPADAVIGDEFKFWQRHFDAAFASPDQAARPAAAGPKSNVPGVAATAAKYLDAPVGGRP